ncbi:MAG: transposase [Methanobrevibacter thaueri]|uniref:RNA-guided endonuclease InsQ/TnpB family protein n=1 Tax=Methanobrevibacter thaueri TaxID=190975 RepID=UPI0026F2EF41|nr:RNA-guided endonuclease TnpB family protein [Methanobrevibacter thaueri]MBE6495515.1 transposase [Methanobrevibacter thaueri]
MFSEYNTVNKGIVVKLYPDESMKDKINQNINNARLTWNKLLEEYQETFELFKQQGYTKLQCNQKTFNTMLNMLKTQYPFLYESESSSLQQVYRDLITAFNRFFNNTSDYPRFKSKKNPKQSFRIQNNNNIKIQDNTIVLPKLGKVHYRTSTHYKRLLKESKINNVTIKKEHGHFYAVFNIETEVETMDYTYKSVGIDLGMRTLAILSNGLKITNLDTTHEEKMIKKYQKSLSRKKYNSNRYNKTLKKLGKWIQRKNNRIKDAYHKLSNYLVKTYDLICMETLDIREIFKKIDLSAKLQNISWYKLVEMIKYKCEWYDKIFVQISQWYPSSKNCNVCGYYNKDLGDEKRWVCPHCKTQHDRDINAAKNIEQEGFRLLSEKNKMNLRDWGDSTVILLSWESTCP